MQREQAKVAHHAMVTCHYAMVTGGCDSKTSSLAAVHDFESTLYIVEEVFTLTAILNSSTAEHVLRDITDDMWSPQKLPLDVLSKSLQELITVAK